LIPDWIKLMVIDEQAIPVLKMSRFIINSETQRNC